MFRRKPKSYGGSFSHQTRGINLKRLVQEDFDITIIGGGITGVAVARDAAMRGMKVSLIEKGDFAGGTSSKSSKMIHGGLRYLKQLNIRLVKESLFEREKLLYLAPHLVHPAPYLIPIYSGWMEQTELHIGLTGYDFLANKSSLSRHRKLSLEEVLREEPLLSKDHLSGGFVYYDCLVDDARLTLATIKSAHEHGAVVANYIEAIGFDIETESRHEVTFREVSTGNEGKIRARVVVVAVGPWTDKLLQIHDHPGPSLRLTKGIHLVFPRKRLNVHKVVVLPTEDKRMIFVVPLGEFSYVGTTDTDYTGSFETILVEAEDVRYLLDALNQSFPSLNLSPTDILSSWAGIRPLLKEEGAPSKVSRDYYIVLYDDGSAIITGGKLTTHRTMAKNLIDQILLQYAHRLDENFQQCRTDEIPLVGGEMADFPSYLKAQSLGLMGRWNLPPITVEHLIKSYGRNHMDILAMGLKDRKLLEPLGTGCPVIKAEAIYAVEEEMALTLEDFMSRRTGLMYFNGKQDLAVAAAKLMGKTLGWSYRRRKAEIRRYQDAAQKMFHFRLSRQ